MSIDISSVDVWAGELEDRPGALASVLAQVTLCAGANLEFLVARPSPERPGCSILYVAPLNGPAQEDAAREAGLKRATHMHVLRLVGADRPGLLAGVAGTLAQADINIVGLTAASAKDISILYVRFASATDAQAAARLLAPVLCGDRGAG